MRITLNTQGGHSVTSDIDRIDLTINEFSEWCLDGLRDHYILKVDPKACFRRKSVVHVDLHFLVNNKKFNANTHSKNKLVDFLSEQDIVNDNVMIDSQFKDNDNHHLPVIEVPFSLIADHHEDAVLTLSNLITNNVILLNERCCDGDMLIHLAAKAGNIAVLAYLLENNAEVHQFGYSNHGTPLMLAVVRGHLDVVKMLINAGSDINYVGDGGDSPLHLAAKHGHEEIVKFLLKAGANMTKPNMLGVIPLAVAIQHGHVNIVRQLLQAEVHYRLNHSYVCWERAAARRDYAVMRLLITYFSHTLPPFDSAYDSPSKSHRKCTAFIIENMEQLHHEKVSVTNMLNTWRFDSASRFFTLPKDVQQFLIAPESLDPSWVNKKG